MASRIGRRFAALLGALALAGIVLGTLPGCNTVKGVGRDIESVGEAGEEVIDGD